MIRLIFSFVLLSILSSCKEEPKPLSTNPTNYKENLIGMNKMILAKENLKMEAYAQDHNLSMHTTESGLMISSRINLDSSRSDRSRKKLSIAYQLFNLNGTLYYQYSESKPFVFEPEKAMIIKGIEEALQYMLPGDSTVLIIPSHLAYGNQGDDSLVPRNASLLCKLKFIQTL